MDTGFELNVDSIGEYLTGLVIQYGTAVVIGIIVLLIGWWLISRVVKVTERVLAKRDVDVSLRMFLEKVLSILLKVVLIITVIGIIGIETTSFIAVLGAMGLAIGLALQGSLANFAGGVIILTAKPFRVGDLIDAEGAFGVVRSINILNTTLVSPHNQVIFVPNGKLAANTIKNFSMEPTRRLDLTFGISYGDDIVKAKSILQRIIDEDPRILKEPTSVVAVENLGDSSVNLVMKVWLNIADYWGLVHDLKERVKLAFDNEGISIPFPQRDIHVFEQKN